MNTHSDRRQAPRLSLLADVRGRIVQTQTPVDVREIGLGGFSIETTDPLKPGDVLSFELMVPDDAPVSLRARVVHCRPKTELDAGGRYVTGLEFLVDGSTEDADVVAALVDRITSVLSFD